MATNLTLSNHSALVSQEFSLSRYIEEIKKFPMLAPKEEYSLAQSWVQQGDTKAAHQLVTSHLRLVVKIAYGFRGYGLPMGEVVSEGNIGLMQAVKKFEPEKGFRLSTYAMWWIKAAIQDYILRSWSLVKIGTTANQKKLFFNLRRLKNQIAAANEGGLTQTQIGTIATKLGVSAKEVTDMDARLSGDASLNRRLDSEGEGAEWQDSLKDESENQETRLIADEQVQLRHKALGQALSSLNEREKDIFIARRLQDEPLTLEDLATKFAISRERVRQIEARAFEKVQIGVKQATKLLETPQPKLLLT
jgi:RNA polymerase sigma-32 factor